MYAFFIGQDDVVQVKNKFLKFIWQVTIQITNEFGQVPNNKEYDFVFSLNAYSWKANVLHLASAVSFPFLLSLLALSKNMMGVKKATWHE